VVEHLDLRAIEEGVSSSRTPGAPVIS